MTRTITLAIACGLVGAARAPAGVTVTLKSQAEPTGSIVRFADVATVTADGPGDAVNAVRLRTVPLMPAPAAGRTAVLAAETVRERALAGGFDVTLAGAKRTTVGGAPPVERAPVVSRPVSPGDKAFAEKFVTAAVSRRLTNAGVGSMRIEVALSPDAARTLARQRPDGCELTGLSADPHVAQTVTLRWLDRLENVTTIQAAVRLGPPKLVPVLTAPVPRGAPITAEHVAWRPEGTTNVPLIEPQQTSAVAGAPATRTPPVALPSRTAPMRPLSANDRALLNRVGFKQLPPELLGRLPSGEAVRDLPAGAVLDESDVRQTPLVRANQTVRVEASVGGVTVTRDLKATRNGLLGQTIPLFDPAGSSYDRRNRIYARVVGNRRAVLVGDGAESPAYADRAATTRTGDLR